MLFVTQEIYKNKTNYTVICNIEKYVLCVY